MKSASAFEKVAARGWNLLNEGKPFTPIFVVGTMLLFHFTELITNGFSLALSFLYVVPLFLLFIYYDFPLLLRSYLWIPLLAFIIIFNVHYLSIWFFALALYYFFTVFFWGTFYYHLRIGTTWWNFTRFWKLVLKNSDSTSGNAQEQMPKFILLLGVWEYSYQTFTINSSPSLSLLLSFYLGIALFSWILHRYLFDWKPVPFDSYTKDRYEEKQENMSDRVIVIVIDGMRKDRFEAAHTPFLDSLKKQGTEYTQMETVYPARTVVCFTSMFTGTYPFEHGIKSNMVWKLGAQTESIFDCLRKVNKKGRLLGIAHLVDTFGKDVDTITAVMHNDVADKQIIKKGKHIMEQENPDLFIMQLISTDQTGHSRGVLYPDYIEKIEETDKLVEDYVNWLQDNGYMENTTLVVCADHGQADGIGGHGHLDEGERFVPFFMNGPHIEKGKRVEKKQSLVSLAPTIAHLLGSPFPGHSRGDILDDSFKE